MTRKFDPALWRDMMDYLRRRHAPICRQWFEQLEPVELDSGLLKVCTTTSVQQNYLQRKCLDQFTEAAQAATGALVAVRFVNREQDRVATTDSEPSGGGYSRSPEGQGGDGHRPSGPSDALDDALNEQIVLSPDYSFDNFVTGPGNRLAYAAAVAVANQPGTAYNPLFIHGGVGLGKTHLLQATCQTIIQTRPDFRICYLSCDVFMHQFVECVQSGQMRQFRHRYRHVDVLVIDDIHCLANRERTQEEFFHTFNELYQSNRQIVLSSDSPPDEIPQLEERLVSRFQWGLVANVTRPDFETRVAIIKAKIKLRDLTMPDDVVCYIADMIDSNARELEGAVTSIQAHAGLQNRPIDLPMAHEALGTPLPDSRASHVTLQSIIDAVTSFYGVKLSDLQSKRRHKSITEPRQICMWLARKQTRFSLQEIGGYFGGRDHTTVMHSIKTVGDRINQDGAFARQIGQLEERIGNHG